MNKNEILTGNKLIAEFIHPNIIWDYEPRKLPYEGHDRIKNWLQLNLKSGWVNQLEYHKSWDWLMPVVEKIEETNFIKIVGKYCGINKTSANSFNNWVATEGVSFTNPKSKIESTYKAVVKFIKWHNKNKE
jgi:hypothetical protein